MPYKIDKSTHKQHTNIKTKNAFILLDFVLALGILSLIAIVLAQATLMFQQHSLVKSKIHLHNLEASNAIDIVRNLLEVEASIDFKDNALRLSNDVIKLESNRLLLDEIPILQNVSTFSITPNQNNGFIISICYTMNVPSNANHTKQTCISRAGFLSTNAQNTNLKP